MRRSDSSRSTGSSSPAGSASPGLARNLRSAMAKRRQPEAGKYTIEDPDPMMQALYGNILTMEEMLQTLRKNAINFVKSVNFMCLNMQTLASNIHTFCSEDDALGVDASRFSAQVRLLTGNESDTQRSQFLSQMEMKVVECFNVNLTVLHEIKERMLERENLRKNLAKPRGVGALLRSAEKEKERLEQTAVLDQMTRDLFEELSALFQFRFDFVRTPYQALKRIQLNFFEGFTNSLQQLQAPAPRPSTAVEPPRAPPPKLSKSAVDIVRESDVVDSNRFREVQAQRNAAARLREGLAKQSENVKRLLSRTARDDDEDDPDNTNNGPVPDENIVATVLDTGFNPDADRPGLGSAYLRLGRAKGDDALDANPTMPTPFEDTLDSPSQFQGASELGPIRINLKGRRSSRASRRADTPNTADSSSNSIRALSTSSPSSADAGHIPMKVPNKHQANGDIIMKVTPLSSSSASSDGHVPMKISSAPQSFTSSEGHIPMKIAPSPDTSSSGHVPVKVTPSPHPPTVSATDGHIPMKISPMPAPKSALGHADSTLDALSESAPAKEVPVHVESEVSVLETESHLESQDPMTTDAPIEDSKVGKPSKKKKSKKQKKSKSSSKEKSKDKRSNLDEDASADGPQILAPAPHFAYEEPQPFSDDDDEFGDFGGYEGPVSAAGISQINNDKAEEALETTIVTTQVPLSSNHDNLEDDENRTNSETFGFDVTQTATLDDQGDEDHQDSNGQDPVPASGQADLEAATTYESISMTSVCEEIESNSSVSLAPKKHVGKEVEEQEDGGSNTLDCSNDPLDSPKQVDNVNNIDSHEPSENDVRSEDLASCENSQGIIGNSESSDASAENEEQQAIEDLQNQPQHSAPVEKEEALISLSTAASDNLDKDVSNTDNTQERDTSSAVSGDSAEDQPVAESVVQDNNPKMQVSLDEDDDDEDKGLNANLASEQSDGSENQISLHDSNNGSEVNANEQIAIDSILGAIAAGEAAGESVPQVESI